MTDILNIQRGLSIIGFSVYYVYKGIIVIKKRISLFKNDQLVYSVFSLGAGVVKSDPQIKGELPRRQDVELIYNNLRTYPHYDI